MTNIYHTSAEEFLTILYNTVLNDSATDITRAYRTFRHVLNEAVNQQTDFHHLRLPGLFAKINHLIQVHDIGEDLSTRINHTRVRLHNLSDISTSTAPQTSLYHDFQAITEFVAAIYKVEIPSTHTALFPQKAERRRKNKSVKTRVRVMVKHWDNEFIHAVDDSDTPREHTICYSESNTYLQGGSHAYLTSLLQTETQLNLVKVREKDGIWMPELIIVEPDILIDVSAVAACIEHYGDSPYTHLLNRLKPYETTEAILLGNLASILLDNALQPAERRKTYKECATEFFHHNALQICTTPLSPSFHTEAQRQNEHIDTLLQEGWKKHHTGFDPDTAMVEPTFFCELLGLQGRMDFLQLDYNLLMEQKSGKGAFPPNPDKEVPNVQEKHYAQMILYMAILHYNFNKKNTNAYLLYSKYSKGLLGLGPAPELLHRTIRLRNQLAWMEKALADTDLARRILTTLTPDRLNSNCVEGTLWERYTVPQIEAILSPIRNATPTLQAYFFRMLRFILTEHLLAKVGNQHQGDSGFASKWHESIEEKLETGNIIYNMVLKEMRKEDNQEAVSHLVLASSHTATSSFRKGDIVVLYAHKEGETPDVRTTMVFRATIADLHTDRITLRLRSPQSNPNVFHKQQGDRWCVEHDYFESSATSLIRSMHTLLHAPHERQQLILAERQPRIDTAATLNGNYGEAFNSLQLRVRQARDLYLIVGPPGTGKTSYGMLHTLQEALTTPGASILLLAYTNRAVDEICSKLIKENINFIRIGSPLTCSDECLPYLLDSIPTQSSSSLTSLLTATRVYAATTTTMNAHPELFRLKHFDLAIIDEASQILEPHLVGLLSAHTDQQPSIDKFVLIGDHKQLPAVVQQTADESAVTDPLLHAIGITDCRHSFFERMYRLYKSNPAICHTLTTHGRMHPDIAHFPNSEFYQNRLQAVPLPHQAAKSAEQRITFIDTSSHVSLLAPHDPQPKTNLTEAEIIADITLQVYKQHRATFDPNQTIGIIVPYRNQITVVRNCIDRYGIDQLHDITIDTVERFQGSQRKVIIYGLTVSFRYQLNFLCSHTFEEDGSIIDRKLNVAMTRAMEQLYLIGNARLLSESITYRHLIEYAQSQGCIVKG